MHFNGRKSQVCASQMANNTSIETSFSISQFTNLKISIQYFSLLLTTKLFHTKVLKSRKSLFSVNINIPAVRIFQEMTQGDIFYRSKCKILKLSLSALYC
jgi:hypothetical protein